MISAQQSIFSLPNPILLSSSFWQVSDGRVLAGHRLRRHFREKGENSHARMRRRRAGSALMSLLREDKSQSRISPIYFTRLPTKAPQHWHEENTTL